jgi:hypothetical protein
MKAISMATQMTIDKFKSKLEEMAGERGFEGHPYHMALEGLEKLGKEEWDPETEEEAVEALAFWCATIVGKTGVSVLNEVLACARICHESDNDEHKHAADEMAASMNFLENMLKVFLSEVDFRHIAEWLFEDGKKRVAEMKTQPQQAKDHEVPADWWKRFRPSDN